jgi:hypothetical protein
MIRKPFLFFMVVPQRYALSVYYKKPYCTGENLADFAVLRDTPLWATGTPSLLSNALGEGEIPWAGLDGGRFF